MGTMQGVIRTLTFALRLSDTRQMSGRRAQRSPYVQRPDAPKAYRCLHQSGYGPWVTRGLRG